MSWLVYAAFTVISALIRQFLLPNPFDCFGDYAFLINLIAEPIIHAVTYGLVGLVYCKGSFPIWGCMLYAFTYALIVAFLALLGIFAFAWWWVLVCIVVLAIVLATVWFVKKLIFG